MNPNSIIVGCYDLKRSYQRNMLTGFGLSASILLLVSLIVRILTNPINPVQVINTPVAPPLPPVIINSPLPPRVHMNTGAVAAKPNFGIIKPVSDDKAPIEAAIPTQNELAIPGPTVPIEEIGNGITINYDSVAALLPSLDTFIPYETPPVQIEIVPPVYPDLAQRAGLEGKVWLRVLVDREGKVREVRVEKSSNPNVGFEDAAVAAAKKTLWKPAIANGLPVAVPVTYSIDFKLRQ